MDLSPMFWEPRERLDFLAYIADSTSVCWTDSPIR